MTNPSKSSKTLFWIGIDVDSRNLVAASSLGNLAPQTFPRTREGVEALLGWAQSLPEMAPHTTLGVAMESTGCYSQEVHQWIAAQDSAVVVSIINPKIMKDYLASRNPRRKTDADDALGIAAFARERNPAGTELPCPVRQALRDVMRARTVLVEQRDALRNHQRTTCKEGPHQKHVSKMVKNLVACIAQLEKEAREIVKRDEALASDSATLESIFGVGKITTLVILAELGNLRRFHSARQLACYCGMTPRVEQSGRNEKRPRLSKVGNPDVRRVLYMAAIVNARYPSTAIGKMYERLLERGMAKRNALVRVMRKLLDRMYLLITKGLKYEAFPETKLAGV